MHFAVQNNSLKAVELICNHVLAYGNGSCDPDSSNLYENQVLLKSFVNKQCLSDDSFTAMHFAAYYGNYQIVDYLLRHGADPFVANNCNINMLHIAAQGDQPLSIALFLKLGLGVNSRDERMSTPLHWSVFTGAELSTTYLLAWGADPNAQDSQGLTALHLAAR